MDFDVDTARGEGYSPPFKGIVFHRAFAVRSRAASHLKAEMEFAMQQLPAAILVLSASVFSYAALSAKSGDQHQASAAFVLAAIVVGLWGMISLVAATMQERDALIDAKSRLDLLDRMISAPVRVLKQAAKKFAELDQPAQTHRHAPPRHVDEHRDRARAVGRARGEAQDELPEQFRYPPKPPRVA